MQGFHATLPMLALSLFQMKYLSNLLHQQQGTTVQQG